MKNKAIELLRGIAAFGIVACHLQLDNLSQSGWNARALCDMNVGLFAALSGFLMWKSNATESWMGYIKKRSARLLPTYFVWTIGYILFGFCFDFLVRHGINPKWTWSYIPSVIFQGGASTHLWFIISLFYSQILFYGIAKYLKGYGAIIVSCIGIVGLGFYHNNWYAYYPLRLLAFLIGGYGIRALIGEKIESNVRKSVIWFGVCAIGIAIHYGLASIIPTFIRDWMVAMPLLVAFIYLPINNEKVIKVATWLGATSMGVFLIHPVITVANLLWVSRVFSTPYGPVAVLTDWVISWLMALVIASIAIRISWMKRWWV